MNQQDLVVALMEKFSLPRRKALGIVDEVLGRLVDAVKSPEGLRSRHFVLKQRAVKPGSKAAQQPAPTDRIRCVLRLREPSADGKKSPKKRGPE